jgi:hypothetical protein
LFRNGGILKNNAIPCRDKKQQRDGIVEGNWWYTVHLWILGYPRFGQSHMSPGNKERILDVLKASLSGTAYVPHFIAWNQFNPTKVIFQTW